MPDTLCPATAVSENGPDTVSFLDYLATDTTFNYDDVGNRTSVVDDDGTVTYADNELNQYTAVADVNCTYDDNGNMTFDGTCEYTYDAENCLIRVRGGDALGAACDTTLTFTTGGDADWFAQNRRVCTAHRYFATIGNTAVFSWVSGISSLQ